MSDGTASENAGQSGQAASRGTDSPEVLERFHTGLELVTKIAGYMRRRLGSVVEYDDLLAAGREGLLAAARRYDPGQGVPFAAFASFRVRGAMLDCVRQMASLSRRTYERLAAIESAGAVVEGQVRRNFGALFVDVGAAENELDGRVSELALAVIMGTAAADAQAVEVLTPEEQLEGAEIAHVAKQLIDGLPAKEAHVIRMHYLEGHTIEEVARRTNLHRAWVCELHARALTKLAKRMRQAL